MFLGLRTVIYPAPDLEQTKQWFATTLGIEPYFDEPFYVGFNVGGYELGLDPNAERDMGPVTYWGVRDAEVAVTQLTGAGAESCGPVAEVGGGIKVGRVKIPTGDTLGIIENPHFELAPAAAAEGEGAGR